MGISNSIVKEALETIKNDNEREYYIRINSLNNKYDNIYLMLINGYIRSLMDKHISNDLILLIELFYNKYNNLIEYNVYKYDKSFLLLNKNCELNINGSSEYFISNNNNKLYVSGDNTFGQLGIGCKSNNIKLILNNNFNSINIISNGLSNKHCFVYSNYNLYGFGDNENNQILCDTNLNSNNNIEIINPILIKYNFNNEILISIKCGESHTLFLTKNGNIFGCGNNQYGQLTFNNKINKYDIKQINILNNIKLINCSCNSSFVLNNNGIMYTFGGNYRCELGINNINIKYTNKLIKININNNIDYICCGEYHVGFIIKNGNGYMFGDNSSGQCGQNDYIYKHVINKPLKLNINYPIINIMCGNEHSIIKTIFGQYYSFGSNYNKQCLINTIKSNNINIPTKINLNYIKNNIGYNKEIINIIPGWNVSYILQKS